MAKADLLTPDRLRKLISYDPETGALTWLRRETDGLVAPQKGAVSTFNTRYAGKPAFARFDRKGYLRGIVLGKGLFAHRVAYAIYHGRWPEHQIDHINGDRTDNRICNLRDATALVNGQNKFLDKRNKSGHSGVFWNARANAWTASIMIVGRRRYLGDFKCKDLAIAARQKAEREAGYSERHGSPRLVP